MDLVWKGILIGAGATILMDLWAVLLWKAFNQGKPDWAFVGRWFWYLKDGKVFHDDIAKAPPVANEQAIGWIGHYVTGIVYGIVLAFAVGPAWFAAPTLLPAMIWGIVTVAAGWFLLQPGLGIGWAASKLPNPNTVRAHNLAAHVVFGLGLWGTALIIG